MQVRFEPAADRILWQVRTQAGEMFSVWLTRRMLRQMWKPFQDVVGQSGLAHAPTAASLMPEAREMLAQTARARPLPGANFNAPFNPQPTAEPLGPEPLLPIAADLGARKEGGGMSLRLRDEKGRSLTVQLTGDLAAALSRLLEKALTDADWGIALIPQATAQQPDKEQAPRLLN
jgi:hypothetical protein